MASPVDTSVKNFNNTMVNAPVINGVAGSLVSALDAFLVTGFDMKTLTSLVALAGVMTATFSGTHSSQIDSVVLVAGVTGGPTGFAGANGEQKIVNRPTSTTATWATTLPDGTYTGTITMKMASMGWTKLFSGTNKAVYQSSDPSSTKACLRVDDTNTTYARVRGYESMSDVDTGVGPFPTDSQVSGGGWWVKSLGASAAAVRYAIIGDGKRFYLNPLPGTWNSAGAVNGSVRFFGDPTPLRLSGDVYLAALAAGTSATSSQGGVDNGAFAQTWVMREFTGLGSSQPHFGATIAGNSGYSGFTNNQGPFPNPIDGGFYTCARVLRQNYSNNYPRGIFPGLINALQSAVFDSFNQLDRVPAELSPVGRALQAWTVAATTGDQYAVTSTSTNAGVVFVDMTGPW